MFRVIRNQIDAPKEHIYLMGHNQQHTYTQQFLFIFSAQAFVCFHNRAHYRPLLHSVYPLILANEHENARK